MPVRTLSIIAPNWKPRYPSTGEWFNRAWYMTYYSATKRKKVLITRNKANQSPENYAV